MLQRRTVLPLLPAALAIPLALPGGQARAAVTTVKLAHSAPADHPLHLRLLQAAQQVQADVGGRLAVQVYPTDQLGSQPDVLGQLRAGAVDFMLLAGLVLPRLVPASAINTVGFVFKDYRTVWQAMDGGLGDFIRSEIDKSGSVFAFRRMFDNGFRHITTSTRPVRSPADLQGLRLRVPPSAVAVAMFKALGAVPTVINTSETYAALQTGTVDGQENPLAVIAGFKFNEVQKYCTLTSHIWDGFWLLGNRAGFDALPADMRASLTRRFDDAALAERSDVAALNLSSREALRSKGLQMFDVAPEGFQQRLRQAGFYREWKARFDPAGWAELEAAVGPL